MLMDFKVIWFTIMDRLVNSYRNFSSSLLFPSSETVQSTFLFLNCVDREVEASKRFPSVIKYSPISQNQNPQRHNSFAGGLCDFLTI